MGGHGTYREGTPRAGMGVGRGPSVAGLPASIKVQVTRTKPPLSRITIYQIQVGRIIVSRKLLAPSLTQIAKARVSSACRG